MISVFGSLVDEEEIANVAACMRSQWMGFGKGVDTFEAKYKAKFGLEHFAMVDSGSNALFMAVTLLDLPPGSEIILPSFTWVSCAQAVLLAGHKPVFCDVDLVTMNVRRQDVEAKITPRTGAIMVVHYAGLAVDMDPILALGYPVIEDAAHAVDSTYQGKPCGAIGDVLVHSSAQFGCFLDNCHNVNMVRMSFENCPVGVFLKKNGRAVLRSLLLRKCATGNAHTRHLHQNCSN